MTDEMSNVKALYNDENGLKSRVQTISLILLNRVTLSTITPR
jgi:hypothetical protein